MDRRSLYALLVVAAAGCGGAGQQTSSAYAPSDPTARGGAGNGAGGAKADAVFKPIVGANSPLGTLKALSEKSPLAKAADGKADKETAAKLGKLDKGGLKLDDGYGYIVAGADSPRTTVGEKAVSVPFPAEAKANPDGSVWVVDGEARRVYTLTDIKREADKPAVVGAQASGDLVRPTLEGGVPPLALVLRAEEAAGEVKHALRILVKGVGAEGAPAAGARVRLKKAASEKGAPPLVKSLLRALKKYGAVLEPGEGAPALSALADPRWTKDEAKAVAALHMADFEVVAEAVKPVSVTKKEK